MNPSIPRGATAVLVLAGAAWLAASRTPAQVPTPVTAPVPRTADGRSDFSGIWQAMTTASWNIQDHQAGKDVPAGQGVVEGNEIP